MFKLFSTFFKMGLFTFGGGYAMIPIMERELVDNTKMITKDEFVDYISVAQSFPGPIAVNLSILLGYRFMGLKGALSSLLGVVLPSFIVILIVSLFYAKTRDSKILEGFFNGVSPVVPALLLVSVLNLFKKINKSTIDITMILVTFIGVALLGINPLWMIGGGVLVGLWNHFYKFS
ncbi:chromate transporter [Acetoanaerobium pronyense]|uniref:Chromate transporter n=1 Tax=Acetoanaerobium pronyense TaxID=1482736 RepID=A0ABS4KGT5_9FIRM|nr:chromate transporter [Acetoanaerobium pronyense]MBP2026565.1 chromate transporter [Acetoanaerobium pronyense]